MTSKQYRPDAIPVPEQGTATYLNIPLLFKKPLNMDRHNVFPVTYTQIDKSESTNNNCGLDKYWERFEGYNLGDLNDTLEQIINEFKQTIQDMLTNVQNLIDELLPQIDNDEKLFNMNVLANLVGDSFNRY